MHKRADQTTESMSESPISPTNTSTTSNTTLRDSKSPIQPRHPSTSGSRRTLMSVAHSAAADICLPLMPRSKPPVMIHRWRCSQCRRSSSAVARISPSNRIWISPAWSVCRGWRSRRQRIRTFRFWWQGIRIWSMGRCRRRIWIFIRICPWRVRFDQILGDWNSSWLYAGYNVKGKT